MKINQLPEVRFPEFKDAWELRKLADVADIIGGGTPSTTNEEYWKGNIDWYSPVEIGEKRYMSGSRKRITALGLQKSSAKILPAGTVLFTSRAGIGKTAILIKEGTTNQGFQSIIPKKDKLDTYFIYSKTDILKHYGEVTGAGSTFIEVSGKQMEKMPILIPKLTEQIQIGAFFKQLDDAIALHQRKLEQHQSIKDGFLQKMFPKDGEKEPEIRFLGFADDWEERELGEISRMYQPLTITGNDLLPDGVPVFGANGFIGFFSEANHIDDQVTISARGEGTGTPSYVHGPVWITGNSMVVNVGDFDIDKYFLFANLTANSLKKYVTGGAQPQLTRDVLVKVPITLPNTDEQKKIGSFFKQLDDTIALHQRELEILKNTKKAFLQKMFV